MEDQNLKQNQDSTTQPVTSQNPKDVIKSKNGLSKGVTILIVLLLIVIIGGAIAFFLVLKQNQDFKNQDNKKDSSVTTTSTKDTGSVKNQITPTPTVDESIALEVEIKDALVKKYNSNTLIVSVSKIEGNYAKGGVTDQGGGGMWFGAKVNGEWKLVWDGNGIILCTDIVSYPDFPQSLLPECYDEVTQNLVKR